jgi:hypothetical protein
MEALLQERASLMQAYADALNDVPIGEDEYYESDDFYEREIARVEGLIIQEIEMEEWRKLGAKRQEEREGKK